MTERNDPDRVDPREKDQSKPDATGTSGNREESMTESGKDAFGRAESGRQSPSESGTTPLGGEPSDAGDRKGPGGVEGKE